MHSIVTSPANAEFTVPSNAQSHSPALGFRIQLVDASGRHPSVYLANNSAVPTSVTGESRLAVDGSISDLFVDKQGTYKVNVLGENGATLGTFTVVALPHLETQSWLPYLDASGQCYAVQAITPKQYTDAEIVPPLVRWSRFMAKQNVQRDFVVSLVSPEDARVRARTFHDMVISASYRAWVNAPGASYKVESLGSMEAFFAQAPALNVPVAYSAPTGGNIARVWSANAPFSNAPLASFIDINWQQEAQASVSPFVPLTVDIGSPSADPGVGKALRAMLVTSVTPTLLNNVAAYSTIRVVRVTHSAVPTGVYTWPLTMTNAGGQSITVNLNVTVV